MGYFTSFLAVWQVSGASCHLLAAKSSCKVVRVGLELASFIWLLTDRCFTSSTTVTSLKQRHRNGNWSRAHPSFIDCSHCFIIIFGYKSWIGRWWIGFQLWSYNLARFFSGCFIDEMQLKDQYSFFDVDARSKDVEKFHHLLSRIRDSVGILN